MDYTLQSKQQMHTTLFGELRKNETTCSRLIFIKYNSILTKLNKYIVFTMQTYKKLIIVS